MKFKVGDWVSTKQKTKGNIEFAPTPNFGQIKQITNSGYALVTASNATNYFYNLKNLELAHKQQNMQTIKEFLELKE